MLAVAVPELGLRGSDVAAATYRVTETRIHGLVLWDSGWYGGNLPLGYSVAFPPLAALIGLVATGVAAASAASWAFDRLTVAAWGRRSAASWYFAATTVVPVAIGQLPFLAGEAAGLLALCALLGQRTALGLGLAVSCALFSPLAAAFLVLAVLAWTLGRAARRPRGGLTVAGGALAVVAGLGVAFPGAGPFPFRGAGLLLTLVVCALLVCAPLATPPAAPPPAPPPTPPAAPVAAPMVGSGPVLRRGAILYALFSLGSFLVPNPLGGNAPRLAEALGVPVLVGLLGRNSAAVHGASVHHTDANRQTGLRRATAVTVALAVTVAGLALWQWSAGLGALRARALDGAARSDYYRPVLAEILGRSSGPVRVEAVPTRDHWESAYLAPRLSLARGWERQLDIVDNGLFYATRPLSPARYLAWLRASGVSWVALPATPLDYAAVGEADLLEHRLPGLDPVWSSAHWRLWRVTGSPGLVTGPARLLALGPDHLRLRVSRPGPVLLRVRYTRYWHAGAGACVRPGPGEWTDLVASRAGPVELSVSLFAGPSSSCP